MRRPGLSSELLSAQEVEHDIVNDVVGRGCLDHGPDRPGQGHPADRLIELDADPGQPVVQDLIVGWGQVDRDPDGLSAGFLSAGLLRRAGPPRRWTIGHNPSLLQVLYLLQSGQAHGPAPRGNIYPAGGV